MRIVLIGRIAAVSGDEEIDRFPTQRARSLLAFLAYYKDRSHPRVLVAEMLWPGGNPDAIRLRLNQTVSELRRTLHPLGEIIQSDRLSLRLDPGVTTDIEEFSRLLRMADLEAQPSRHTSLLDEAANLGQGELAPGIYEDWVGNANAYLSERLKFCLIELTDLAMAEQRWADAARFAKRASEIDPYSDSIRQKLLRSLLQAEDRTEAIFQYSQFERLLREEFALEPSEATKQLMRGLLPVQKRTEPSHQSLTLPILQTTTMGEVFDAFIGASNLERAMQLAYSLLPYWNLAGQLSVGRQLLQQIFAMPAASVVSPEARCVGLIGLGATAVSVGDFNAAQASLAGAAEIADSLSISTLQTQVCRVYGQLYLRRGNWEEAQQTFDRAVQLSERLHDPGAKADALTGLGEVFRFKGELGEAENAHREALELRVNLGRSDLVAHSHLNLGIVLSRREQYELALAQIVSALGVLRRLGSKGVVADCLMEIAGIHASSAQPRRAARLLAAV